jgi:MFS family permease
MACAALLPVIAGTAVLLFVPSDRAAMSPSRRTGERRQALEPFRWTFQFGLIIVLFFTIFALNQIIRFTIPINLRIIEGREDVEGLTGLANSLAGLASAVSVIFLAPRVFQAGSYAKSLAGALVIAGLGYVVVAFAGSTGVFFAGLLAVALILSAMIPATNTLVASNVSRARRGTAFGIASSAQAVSLMGGSIVTAAFAAVSLELGFVVLATTLLMLAIVILTTLREPSLDSEGEPARPETAPVAASESVG